MKKKLNIQLILMTIVIIFFTLTLTVIEFYKLFEREVIENLKTISNVIIATDGYYETDNICTTMCIHMLHNALTVFLILVAM